MSFISTTLKCAKSGKYKGRGFQKERVINGRKSFVCVCCKKELDISLATIEHIVPRIVIRASFGKVKNLDAYCVLACYKCNCENLNIIPSAIGDIWKSRDIRLIQASSRYLCNLIRKKYENLGQVSEAGDSTVPVYS